MIRVVTIESDKVALHERHVLACDRCARWCFVTIWEVYVDGKVFELCDHCANSLDGKTGIDVVRALRPADRKKNFQPPPSNHFKSRSA